jgi:hypothetical protein
MQHYESYKRALMTVLIEDRTARAIGASIDHRTAPALRASMYLASVSS